MKEEDILARHSRPQKHSTWVPKKRDWRYATGVFKHDDLEGAPKDRSAWDDMDYDYQVADKRKSRDRSGSGQSDGDNKTLSRSVSASGTPESTKRRHLLESPKTIVSVEAFKKKTKTAKRNVWQSVSRCHQIGKSETEGDQPAYETYSLTVRLRFSGKLIIEDALPRMATSGPIERIQLPGTPANLKMLQNLDTPATARTATSLYAPHTLGSIESVYTYPLFQRTWVDETKDFNMRAVRGILQKPGATNKDLGANYAWYNDAVPVDALLPPGISLSAKEVNAYYPHHVRWKGMMLRLANNDYRGPDIMGIQAFFRGPPTTNMSGAVMNQMQRDSVKNVIIGFKTDTVKGKHDCNLHTDQLEPGKYIAGKRSGYTLPTFDDLLRGLHHLPSGLDARGLTECLSWYLNFRDSFTPKLNLNVLHTQALIRALRIPLKRFGPQNLDCNALKEWKEKGKFEERKVYYEPAKPTSTKTENTEQKRSQLHMNLDDYEVNLDVQLPLRHVLTFPFLALHGVMGEALKLGIEKAGNRKAERKAAEGRRMLEAKWAAKLAGTTDSEEEQDVDAQQAQEMIEEPRPAVKAEDKTKTPYRIPKRTLTTEALHTLAPAPKKAPTAPPVNGGPLGHRAPTGPRATAPSTQAFGRESFTPPGPTYLNRAWGAPAPSSAYAPHSAYEWRGPPYGSMEELWDDIPRRAWRSVRKKLGLAASADVAILATMLKGTASMAESKLGFPISAILSFPALPALYQEDVAAAAEYIGLRTLTISGLQLHELVAAYAGHGMGLSESDIELTKQAKKPHEFPGRHTVLVEYTEVAILLYRTVLERASDIPNIESGTRTSFGLGSSSFASNEEVRDFVLEHLREVYSGYTLWGFPEEITVIMTGSLESVGRVGFRLAIAEAVEMFGSRANILYSDPEYVAARGATEIAWRALPQAESIEL